MIHNKSHLIHPGCLWPSIALTVHIHGLKTPIYFVNSISVHIQSVWWLWYLNSIFVNSISVLIQSMCKHHSFHFVFFIPGLIVRLRWPPRDRSSSQPTTAGLGHGKSTVCFFFCGWWGERGGHGRGMSDWSLV